MGTTLSAKGSRRVVELCSIATERKSTLSYQGRNALTVDVQARRFDDTGGGPHTGTRTPLCKPSVAGPRMVHVGRFLVELDIY